MAAEYNIPAAPAPAARSVETTVPPKVSVCCAWYNRADYIRDTLDSLLAQEYDAYEIIIVNDGSPDPRVRQILESYEDERLLIIHQDNIGFVGAIRRAIELSSGEYIAIQGAGDVSLPRRLNVQADILDAYSEIGVVGCKIEHVIFGGPTSGRRTEGKVRTFNPKLHDFLKGGNPFSHGEVMFRRSLYDSVGGYRQFFKFAQDRDLWIRMASFCSFRIVNEKLYERRIFNTDGIATDRTKLLLQQALSNFARQCYYDRRFNNGRDYVDIYGSHAGIFRRPSAALANFCAKNALQAFTVDDSSSALFFCRAAFQEKKTPLVIATIFILTASQRSQFATKLLRGILSRHRSSSRWTSKKASL